jgi:hypothetical protein
VQINLYNYIINAELLLHVSATIMTILREVHYKDGYIDVFQKMVNQCTDVKYCSQRHGLKYILKYNMQIIFVFISIV